MLAVIAVWVWGSALTRPYTSGVTDVGMLFVAGFLISGVILLIGGVVQSHIGPRRSGLSNYIFGAAAIIIGFALVPMFTIT